MPPFVLGIKITPNTILKFHAELLATSTLFIL